MDFVLFVFVIPVSRISNTGCGELLPTTDKRWRPMRTEHILPIGSSTFGADGQSPQSCWARTPRPCTTAVNASRCSQRSPDSLADEVELGSNHRLERRAAQHHLQAQR